MFLFFWYYSSEDYFIAGLRLTGYLSSDLFKLHVATFECLWNSKQNVRNNQLITSSLIHLQIEFDIAFWTRCLTLERVLKLVSWLALSMFSLLRFFSFLIRIYCHNNIIRACTVHIRHCLCIHEYWFSLAGVSNCKSPLSTSFN